MKKLLLFLLPVLLKAQYQAPEWEWDLSFDTQKKIQLSVDPFDNLYYYGHNDTVYKCGPDKYIQYKFAFKNAKVTAVKSAENGNVYVAGLFEDILKIGKTILTSRGGADIFICHLNTEGQLIWLKQIGSAGNETDPSLCIHNGEAYLCASSSDTTYFDDEIHPKNRTLELFVAKYNATEGLIKTYFTNTNGSDKSSITGSEICIDHDNSIILLSTVTGTVNAGGLDIEVYESPKVIIKLDEDFRGMWFKTMTDFFSFARDLTVDSENNIYCVKVQCSTHVLCSAWVQKFTPDGQKYTRLFYGSGDLKISMNDKNIIAYSYVGYRPGQVWMTYTQVFIHAGIYKNGVIKERVDSVREAGCYDIKLNESNHLFLSEWNSCKMLVKDSVGGPGTFIAKMNLDQFVGVEQQEKSEPLLNLSPNPSSGKFNLSGLPQNSELKIYNVCGTCIYSDKITLDSIKVDISGNSPGIYFLEAKSKEGIVRKKLVIE